MNIFTRLPLVRKNFLGHVAMFTTSSIGDKMELFDAKIKQPILKELVLSKSPVHTLLAIRVSTDAKELAAKIGGKTVGRYTISGHYTPQQLLELVADERVEWISAGEPLNLYEVGDCWTKPVKREPSNVYIVLVDSGFATHLDIFANTDIYKQINISLDGNTRTSTVDSDNHGTFVFSVLHNILHSTKRIKYVLVKGVDQQRPVSTTYLLPILYSEIEEILINDPHGRVIVQFTSGAGEDNAMRALVEDLIADFECIIVAAAGNSGLDDGKVAVPAAAAGVLSVGALNGHGNIAAFSSFDNETLPSLWAPGTRILGYTANNEKMRRSGTSYATPLVTARLAQFLLNPENYDLCCAQIQEKFLAEQSIKEKLRTSIFTLTKLTTNSSI